MKRSHTLDTIRGCALLSMLLYHAAWDLVYLFGAASLRLPILRPQ